MPHLGTGAPPRQRIGLRRPDILLTGFPINPPPNQPPSFPGRQRTTQPTDIGLPGPGGIRRPGAQFVGMLSLDELRKEIRKRLGTLIAQERVFPSLGTRPTVTPRRRGILL